MGLYPHTSYLKTVRFLYFTGLLSRAKTRYEMSGAFMYVQNLLHPLRLTVIWLSAAFLVFSCTIAANAQGPDPLQLYRERLDTNTGIAHFKTRTHMSADLVAWLAENPGIDKGIKTRGEGWFEMAGPRYKIISMSNSGLLTDGGSMWDGENGWSWQHYDDDDYYPGRFVKDETVEEPEGTGLSLVGELLMVSDVVAGLPDPKDKPRPKLRKEQTFEAKDGRLITRYRTKTFKPTIFTAIKNRYYVNFDLTSDGSPVKTRTIELRPRRKRHGRSRPKVGYREKTFHSTSFDIVEIEPESNATNVFIP